MEVKLKELKPIDGRTMGFYLTDERKKLMTNTIEKLVYIENQIFDSWSEEERQ